MTLNRINIEPTNKCQSNFFCYGDDKNRKTGFMTLKNYRKILKMIPYPTEIRLFMSGEPFLHPNIIKMIDIACMRGHTVMIHSNGFALKRKHVFDLIEMGFKYPGRILLNFIMQGGVVPKNVDMLIEYQKNLHITLERVVPYPERKEVPEFMKMYGGKVRFYIRWPRNRDDKVKEPFRENPPGPCDLPEDSAAIYWNGEYPICSTDFNKGTCMVNILKDGLGVLAKSKEKFRGG